MLFHSTLFGVFFAVVCAGYFLLSRWRLPRVLFLLVASYAFYAGWSVQFAGLIVLQTVSDYYLAILLHRLQNQRLRQALLWTSIVVNLGILATFKYFNFFIDAVADTGGLFGLTLPRPVLEVALPVGISFYTFHTLSYVLDVYFRKIEPARNLAEFALAVVFFPQLVAGPIVRAAQFLPQLEEQPRWDGSRIRSGLFLMFQGLFKKVLIADVLAETIVDAAYADPGIASGYHLLIATYAYAFQLYCDFSGYTDVALGAARVLGFELPLNFDSPYQATSIRDFWRRWHVSLSTFFRDYLFFPLGGSRFGALLTCRNLLITMALTGLWHGAAWNFVLFGLLHGAWLAGEHLWRRWRGITKDAVPLAGWQRWAAIVATFHVLCLSFVLFRAQSLADMGTILHRIATWAASPGDALFLRERGLWILLLAILVHYLPTGWYQRIEEALTERCPAALQGGLAVIALGAIGISYVSSHPFVYFQF